MVRRMAACACSTGLFQLQVLPKSAPTSSSVSSQVLMVNAKKNPQCLHNFCKLLSMFRFEENSFDLHSFDETVTLWMSPLGSFFSDLECGGMHTHVPWLFVESVEFV